MQTNILSRTFIMSLAIATFSALYFGLATPAEAKTVRQSSLTSSTTVSCVSEAIIARESAIMTAWTNFSEDINLALIARQGALVEAWNMESPKELSAAVKDAWKNWKASSKTAHSELKSERKTAWNAFKETVRTECKVRIPKEEALEKAKSDTLSL